MIVKNSKLPKVGTSIFSTMSTLSKQYNAINLSQGFPDFESDPELIDLVTEAMNSGYNQYAPMPGLLELRVAIANKFKFLYNSSYHPEKEITITAGATQAIYTIISTFIDEGDEVIIFTPAYDCYAPCVQLNKGKIIPIQLYAPDYKVDWNLVKDSISSKTRMIIINSPHNPSGTILSDKDMLQLQDIVSGSDILILSDEVYEHIVFDEQKHHSICLYDDLKERSFITASFGKTFHNTGWKIGYCCAPEGLMAEFRKIHQFNVFCVNHPIQKALAKYLETPDHYVQLSTFYQRKRDLFLNLIKDSRFKFIPSKGTYFQGLDYSEITDMNDLEFAKELTIKNGIASIPLSVFNSSDLDQNYLRFCFAKSEETLIKAAEILLKI